MIRKLGITFLLIIFLAMSGSFVLAADATPEGNSVLQKIKEKVEAIRKNPKAYIGTITDKTQDSIQIKNVIGKIQQISIKDNVQFVKIGKTQTSIKFTDIALGDFIVAMGYTNSNSLLDARRILLISPLLEAKRQIVFGNIESQDKKDMVITDTNNQKVSIVFPKSWKGPDLKELSQGQKVLVVVKEIDGKLTVRTLQVVTTSISVAPTLKLSLTPFPTK